jgi:hypothetical protein
MDIGKHAEITCARMDMSVKWVNSSSVSAIQIERATLSRSPQEWFVRSAAVRQALAEIEEIEVRLAREAESRSLTTVPEFLGDSQP